MKLICCDLCGEKKRDLFLMRSWSTLKLGILNGDSRDRNIKLEWDDLCPDCEELIFKTLKDLQSKVYKKEEKC